MALSYKARRRWSLFLLLVGMPAWIILAVGTIALFDRPPIWLELMIYVALGVVWILPFKAIFKGIGQADTSDTPDETKGR